MIILINFIQDEIYQDDHLVVLHKGQIKANGSVSDVLAQTQANNIHDAFKHLTQG